MKKPFVLERAAPPVERLRWLLPEISSVAEIHRLVMLEIGYDFRLRSNEPKFVAPRQVSIWLMRTLANQSYPQIARFYSLDHSTVMYAYRKIERERKRSPACQADLDLFARLFDQSIGNNPASKPISKVAKSHPEASGTSAS